MLRYFIYLSFLFIGILSSYADKQTHIRTISELKRSVLAEEMQHNPFTIDVTFVNRSGCMIFIEDKGGGFYVEISKDDISTYSKLQPGDKVQITGEISLTEGRRVIPKCKSLSLREHGVAPTPRPTTGKELATGAFDYRYVTLLGTIKDTFFDEIDPGHIYVRVDCDGQNITTCPLSTSLPALHQIIGAKTQLAGFCDPRPLLRRERIGRFVYLTQPFATQPDSSYDPFNVPNLLDKRLLDPKELSSLDRCRAEGLVIATWNDYNALVQVKGNFRDEFVRVSFALPDIPRCNEQVEVSGFPGTDFYEFTLSRAIWRPRPSSTESAAPIPITTDIRTLRVNESGRPRHHPFLINHLVTVRGHVRDISNPIKNAKLLLESNGFSINVNISSCPGILEQNLKDCEVAATGYVIPDVEGWSPNNFFPKIQDLFIVMRTPDDLTVIAHPPWWTPFRLLVMVIILLIIIMCIVSWNIMLRRLAERRGRELAAETVSHAEANMRTFERTRLAVELHDALSQNLTGVAMRIQAAEQYAEGASPELTENLSIAERTLKSCRTELKNCLWDLRNQALEEATIDAAIRLTLKPYLSDVSLALRFNVPRSRVTDNTMHTLLRIIRELAVNGIRHGHASEIKIAGSIEDNVLKFSVADNGCGFDPNLCPGVDQGHFGLEGIRERIRLMSGTMTVSSQPGQGSKTTIALHMPKEC